MFPTLHDIGMYACMGHWYVCMHGCVTWPKHTFTFQKTVEDEMDVCVDMYLRVGMCVYVCMCVCVYVCMCVCVCVCGAWVVCVL
jgi:hypothetical protein